MRFRNYPVCYLAVLLLGGCHNREAQIPGSWSGGGTVMTIRADKTFSLPIAGSVVTAAGTWSFDGADLTLTPVAIGGQRISDVKARLEASVVRMGSRGGKLKTMADDLDKPNILKLSDDGKTMTTDKSRDKNSGPPETFTKQ